MILSLQRHVHDAISEAIRKHFGVADVPAFAIEVPPTRTLGDLAVPVAFQLARILRKAPRNIAQELSQALGDIPGIARVVATPNLNHKELVIAAAQAGRCGNAITCCFGVVCPTPSPAS